MLIKRVPGNPNKTPKDPQTLPKRTPRSPNAIQKIAHRLSNKNLESPNDPQRSSKAPRKTCKGAQTVRQKATWPSKVSPTRTQKGRQETQGPPQESQLPPKLNDRTPKGHRKDPQTLPKRTSSNPKKPKRDPKDRSTTSQNDPTRLSISPRRTQDPNTNCRLGPNSSPSWCQTPPRVVNAKNNLGRGANVCLGSRKITRRGTRIQRGGRKAPMGMHGGQTRNARVTPNTPEEAWGLFVCLSVRPSVRPSIHRSVRPFVRPPVCPSVLPMKMPRGG